MKPSGGNGAKPARARAHRSSQVNGHGQPNRVLPSPHTTAATCSGSVRLNLSAANPPVTRYAMNAKCTVAVSVTRISAAISMTAMVAKPGPAPGPGAKLDP